MVTFTAYPELGFCLLQCAIMRPVTPCEKKIIEKYISQPDSYFYATNVERNGDPDFIKQHLSLLPNDQPSLDQPSLDQPSLDDNKIRQPKKIPQFQDFIVHLIHNWHFQPIELKEKDFKSKSSIASAKIVQDENNIPVNSCNNVQGN